MIEEEDFNFLAKLNYVPLFNSMVFIRADRYKSFRVKANQVKSFTWLSSSAEIKVTYILQLAQIRIIWHKLAKVAKFLKYVHNLPQNPNISFKQADSNVSVKG